jgi:hypothetical protein
MQKNRNNNSNITILQNDQYNGNKSNGSKNLPEPFASKIDLITAGQYMETAIHSPDVATTRQAINNAITYIQYARNYWLTAMGTHQFCNNTLRSLRDQSQSFINQLQSISVGLTSTNLKSQQENNLYNQMGTLGAIYNKNETLNNYSDCHQR